MMVDAFSLNYNYVQLVLLVPYSIAFNIGCCSIFRIRKRQYQRPSTFGYVLLCFVVVFEEGIIFCGIIGVAITANTINYIN